MKQSAWLIEFGHPWKGEHNKKMNIITIYSDGAASPNPGLGGWGAIIENNGKIEHRLSGGEFETTNNRMEIMGILTALECIEQNYPNAKQIQVISDSKYVTDTFNQNWIHAWLRNNWKKSNGQPVLNRDLWERMVAMTCRYQVTFKWIKGHAGHPRNEECDQMAVAYRLQLAREHRHA